MKVWLAVVVVVWLVVVKMSVVSGSGGGVASGGEDVSDEGLFAAVGGCWWQWL